MPHYRAVKFEILILEDAHVSASELRDWIFEAIDLHIEPRQVEVEILEDHAIYADGDEEAKA